MQAVIIARPGAAEVLQLAERAAPVPGFGEVRIKVAAAGVNRADLLQREGKYPPPAGAPVDVPGLEVAGTVAETGPGCVRWRVGDRVMALLAGGGYAAEVVAAEGVCLPVPDNIPLREAAGLPEALFTVWANLFVAARLRGGETALVHGGTSGIGSMACQMLRAHGVKVIATAGGAEKAAWCKALGVERVVDYQAEDFVAAVKAFTGGKGVDAVLDMVGGDYLARHLACLGMRGRLVWIAAQRGVKGELDIRAVMQTRAVLTGAVLRGRSLGEKTRLAHMIERRALPWLADGLVKPLISHFFPIKQAAEGHKVLESGLNRGKVVLEVGV